MQKKTNKNSSFLQTSDSRPQKGFTLIEMLVAVIVLALIIGSATGLFISAIRSQAKALVAQKLLDETGYVMEYMSRALRMAKKDMTGGCIPVKQNYQLTASGIKFLNYQDICQEFYLGGDDKLYEDKDGYFLPLTSGGFEISSLNFNLSGEAQDYLQPRVTILMTIKKTGATGSEVKIQTTISQRNLDVQQ